MNRNSFQVTSNSVNVCVVRIHRDSPHQSDYDAPITLWIGWHQNDKTKKNWSIFSICDLLRATLSFSSVKIEMLALKMKNIFVYLKTTHIFCPLSFLMECVLFLFWLGLVLIYTHFTHISCTLGFPASLWESNWSMPQITKCGYIHIDVHPMCVPR